MNTLYSRNRDMEEDEDEPLERDREMTLGTSFIIGIFFALVLICAIFFAFGYSLGRRSALPASGTPAATAASQDTGSSNAKPSSGVPASQSASSDSDSSPESSPDSSTDSTSDISSSAQQAPPAATQAPRVVPAKLNVKPTPASHAAAPAPAISATGHLVVQVAAVSRKSDADMLMSALKRHGYDAAIHQSPQDKLLHVQIGPFATKQDADAMRKKLIGDGYNAIVK